MPSSPADFDAAAKDVDDDKHHKTKRFRFKRKSEHQSEDQKSDHHTKASRRHHHSHYHRSKRRKSTPHSIDDPSAYDDSVSGLPPDTAFRESLFDALGDDEGAAFWQGVYGQSIHDYPNKYKDEETGELETMGDEEYAQYVRRKMWEKSWEGIEAAKEEKRREREQEKKRIRDQECTSSRPAQSTSDKDFVFDIEFDRSLKRGERRRDKKRWQALWKDYIHCWEDLETLREGHKNDRTESKQLFLRNKIAWPVESGKRKDLDPPEIERFITKCAESADGEQSISNILKAERIRWHPDKMQQRYGFMEIDTNTMQGVTSTFQVLDRMWNQHRPG